MSEKLKEIEQEAEQVAEKVVSNIDPVLEGDVNTICCEGYQIVSHTYITVKSTEYEYEITKGGISTRQSNEDIKESIQGSIQSETKYIQIAESIDEFEEIYGWESVPAENGILYRFDSVITDESIIVRESKSVEEDMWETESTVNGIGGSILHSQVIMGLKTAVRMMSESNQNECMRQSKVEEALKTHLPKEVNRVSAEQAEKIARRCKGSEADSISHSIKRIDGIGEAKYKKIREVVKEKNLITDARAEADRELVQNHGQYDIAAFAL